jgi:hypothetical protein
MVRIHRGSQSDVLRQQKRIGDDVRMKNQLSGTVEDISPMDIREKFEAFFTTQPFFNNLKYMHGDRLFDFDVGIGYRNLTVQVGYVCFCKGDREFVLND